MAKKNNAPAKPKLPPEEALYQAVSLCRKAGALTMGFDAVEEACVKSKAWLVMTASDISPKTLQRLNYAVGDLVDVFTMPLTQDKLADISHKPVAVYAVTDRNLAKLCFDRLCARLTGYNIDIRPESGYYGEDEEPKKDAADAE